MLADAALACHWTCTLLMTGIIWFVQIVHYPLMADVGPDCFVRYAAQHRSRTTWVVVGPMILEVGTAILSGVFTPALWKTASFLVAGLLLVAIWSSTFWWQVPLHARLSGGYDEGVIGQLVRSNWVRTIGWSLRAALVSSVFWSRWH